MEKIHTRTHTLLQKISSVKNVLLRALFCFLIWHPVLPFCSFTIRVYIYYLLLSNLVCKLLRARTLSSYMSLMCHEHL